MITAVHLSAIGIGGRRTEAAHSAQVDVPPAI
jgi:hypothetical protein